MKKAPDGKVAPHVKGRKGEESKRQQNGEERKRKQMKENEGQERKGKARKSAEACDVHAGHQSRQAKGAK